MFQKILIANRGEIACRVAATARRMAIRTVAVYSDVDAGARHVQACDEAVHLGGNAPKDSYLRWEKIIDAALAAGAQAIHPGYGFLSENQQFAQACADAGLVFVGPPASAIAAMGRKAQSKQLMARAGVPLVPGYHGADQDPALLQQQADSIGYPVLIKASAGGGGKGMRAVDCAADFAQALQACKREAASSFGDDAVLIEKYVQRPRHVEIQVFADSHGNFVHLFERDCSVQRRHQKVLEEAPAPGMTQALRAQMGQAAVAAARAVQYVGAGTVEFIVEQSGAPGGGIGNFYFMEMNTRLQVEHPVTEAITGLDLVEWQLRVAAGERLPLAQDQLRIGGHAIEARLCAEIPDRQFLPATGTLHTYALPPCNRFERADHGVRLDSGVRQGDSISPHYDSMIAKLIVHGATREEALARMDRALSQVHIAGLPNNVQFLREVVRCASFAQGRLDTGLIGQEAAALFQQDRMGLELSAAAAVADTLRREGVPVHDARERIWSDPWAQGDGWQSHGDSQRAFELEYREARHAVVLHTAHDGAMQLQVGDTLAPLQVASGDDGALSVQWGTRGARLHVYRHGERLFVFAPQGASELVLVDALAHAGDAHADAGRLTAPMPGKVVSFAVTVGQQVSKGQVLALIDAMKMEHSITAPAAGRVTEIMYSAGDQVTEGAELLRLEPVA
jgi:3-methylcrotonyl-CoA carboxylase alpha subunit